MFNSLFSFLKGNSLQKNLFTLIKGTGGVEMIHLLAYPLLTRLYQPQDFGVYAVYLSTVSVFALVASGKYEEALILPEYHQTAKNLLFIAISIAAIVSIAGIFIIIIGTLLNVSMINCYVHPWIILIPVGVFMSAAFNAFTNWEIRQKHFKRLSLIRIYLTTAIIIITVLFSFIFSGFYGLILGNFSGLMSSLFLFSVVRYKALLSFKHTFSKFKFMYTLRFYNQFPRYSVLSTWLKTGSAELPNLILACFFGKNVVGQFAISMKLINIPVKVLSVPLGELFYQNAAKMNNAGESIRNFYQQFVMGLTVCGIVMIIPFLFVQNNLIIFLLGKEWEMTSTFIKMLVPWLFFNFIYFPLACVFNIKHKLYILLMINVLFFVFRIGGILVGGIFNAYNLSILLFSVLSALVCIMAVIKINSLVKRP